MNTVEEIEQVIAQLAPEEFGRLSSWIAERNALTQPDPSSTPTGPRRDHSAFLNSYTPEDEGLYDNAAGR